MSASQLVLWHYVNFLLQLDFTGSDLLIKFLRVVPLFTDKTILINDVIWPLFWLCQLVP